MSIKKNKSRLAASFQVFYTLLFFTLLVISCRSGNIKTKNTEETASVDLQKVFRTLCTYSLYNTSAGVNKGAVFVVEVYKDSLNEPYLTIDSLIIGGINMPFVIRNTENPLLIDASYLPDKPDPIIDQKQFEPAWLIVTFKGKQSRFPIEYIFYKSY